MFAGKRREFGSRDVRRANAIDLVGRNGHANARTANEHAAIGLATCNVFCNQLGEIGIVDTIV